MRILILKGTTRWGNAPYRLRALDNSITVDFAEDVPRAAEMLGRGSVYDVVVLDYDLVDAAGNNATQSLRALSPDTATIVTTETDTPELARSLTRLGVHDCIPRAELSPERLVRAFYLSYERQRRENQLRCDALQDSLTQTLNRRGLLVALGKSLETATQFGTYSALCCVDIDHFKDVNDTFGHLAGDEVLRQSAARMQSSIRINDDIGRPGGDEFWLVLNGVGRDDIPAIVSKVHNCFKPLFRIGEQDLRINVSIGCATAPKDSDCITGWIDCADRALYEAKRGGRNDFCIYTENPEHSLTA